MVDVATTGEVGLAILQNWIGIAATITGFAVFTGIIWRISKKWNSIETKQDQQHECIERLESKIDKTVEVAVETKNELKTDIAGLASETREQTIKLTAIDEKVEYNDKASVSLAQGLEKQSDFFTKWLQRVEDIQRFGAPMRNMQPQRMSERLDSAVETEHIGHSPAYERDNPSPPEIERQLLDIQRQIDRISKRDDRDHMNNDYRQRNVSARKSRRSTFGRK